MESGRVPALLRADRVHVPAGAWRGRDIVDERGNVLGKAKRGWLYDANGQCCSRESGRWWPEPMGG
jgi:hypothetical protein